MVNLIAPGLYFGLDEEAYHADPALGSSGMKKLVRNPCDYWFGSPYNPNRPSGDPTPAQLFGRAVHKLVLEGRQSFEGCYAPAYQSGNTKAGKEERAAITAAGKSAIKADDYARMQMAGQMIRANPELEEAFSGGYPEVSVFWEANGIRKKARFDYLKARAIVDLKSIRNTRSIDFVQACCRAIAEFEYHVQAEHYREGREAARKFIRSGEMIGFTGDEDDWPSPEWLKNVANQDAWAFVFVFYQAENAPLTWATALSPGNTILDIAREQLARAEDNFKTFMDRFGPDTPWVLRERLTELDLSELPPWFAR